jgi:hypothetical protein
MDDLKTLREQNQHWHEQHAQWVEDVQKWQRETQRLTALLYQLERALPDHSTRLTKHLVLIDDHEEIVRRYECGLDDNCLTACPDFKTEQEQKEMRLQLCQLHSDVEREHEKLKQQYAHGLERFRALTKRLLNES